MRFLLRFAARIFLGGAAFFAGAALPVAAYQAQSANTALAGPEIRVRLADYDRYSRLVFDFKERRDYQISQEADRVTLVFSGLFRFDTKNIYTEPRAIGPMTVGQEAGDTYVHFLVPAGAKIQDFRSGLFVVLDIFTAKDGQKTVPKDLSAGNIGAPKTKTAESAIGKDEGKQAQDKKAQDAEASPAPSSTIAQQQGLSIISLQAQAAPDALETAAPDKKKSSSNPIFEKVDNGVSIRFPMPENTALAAFERGGFLWLVFDRQIDFDTAGLSETAHLAAGRINHIEEIANPDAFVLKIDFSPNQSRIVEKSGSDWQISLKDTPAKPRFPLSAAKRIAKDSQQQSETLFIAAANVGRKIRLTDTSVGDDLIVFPIQDEGRGMSDVYRSALAILLESAQGLAIVPQRDQVQIERFREGVAIGEQGQILSPPDEENLADLSGSLKLVDFNAWRLGKEFEYRKNKSLALYALSVAPKEQLNKARWQLARFYVGYRRGAEALAVLNLMLQTDPSLDGQGDFRAVRGIANYFMHRMDEAAEDFAHPALAAEQDAELWRALIAESRGKYKEALEHYRRGRDVLGAYDNPEKVRIAFAVIRAALALKRLPQAEEELTLLSQLSLSPKDKVETVLLSAELEELIGNDDLALAQYEDLANSPYRDLAARARLDAVRYKIQAQPDDIEAAINELEALRYAWRSDRFEFNVIKTLSELYFKARLFEEGLAVLKVAASVYPDDAKESRIPQQMQKVFKDLFLGAEADSLNPIEGITLFRKFQEFTPPGVEGDTMIRRLADRLVAIDLLEQAAGLLDYQVKERLEGAPRAQIAANLAKIYILDKSPDKALEIIRATREPLLPKDIEQERFYVEARALMELGKYEEAEILLEPDTSLQAEAIKADIFWESRDYTRLKPSLFRLLGDSWQAVDPLNAIQRFNIMRLTLAMTFDGDQAGLMLLRERYGVLMQNGEFATSFELLTNNQEKAGLELREIVGQIAAVAKLQSFIQDYRKDFSNP